MDLKKKIENIWFYYKVPIIIAAVVLIVIGEAISLKKNTPKYDHSIAIISKENYPNQEQIDKLKNIYEDKYGDSFDITIYNIALGQIGEDDSLLSKLDLDLRNRISEYIFIEDLEAFKKATNNQDFGEVTSVSSYDYLQNLGLDNFYLITRK